VYKMEHSGYPRYVTSLQDCLHHDLHISKERLHYPLVRIHAPEVGRLVRTTLYRLQSDIDRLTIMVQRVYPSLVTLQTQITNHPRTFGVKDLSTLNLQNNLVCYGQSK
jgi:hypothetical protein